MKIPELINSRQALQQYLEPAYACLMSTYRSRMAQNQEQTPRNDAGQVIEQTFSSPEAALQWLLDKGASTVHQGPNGEIRGTGTPDGKIIKARVQ